MAPIVTTQKIVSLKALRQLSITSDALSRTYERLSSGTRINSASDDAAGLAVAAKLKSNARLLGRASHNLSDGLSVLAVADGALGELSSVLSRLTELAAQSANSTYTSSQREAVDEEAQALAEEYNRIARSTTFNGRALFNGDFQSLGVAAGITGASNSVIQSGLGGGIGNGTFQTTVTIAQNGYVGGLISADLNQDGFLDVATATSSNIVQVSLGVGDGTFTSGGTFAISGNSFALEEGDFNGDGLADLVSMNAAASSISVLIGNGDGTFAASQSYATGSTTDGGVTVGDVNCDGDVDILTADFDTNVVSVFLGVGDGTFASRVSFSVAGGPSGITLGDFNGDGSVDFVSSNYTSGTISLAYGNGNGTFQTSTSYATQGLSADPHTTDFNQDGFTDFTVLSYTTGNIQTFFGAASGLTAGPVSTPSSGLSTFEFGDYDGDGTLDIIAADYNNARVAILRGDGTGSFTPATSMSAGGSITETFRVVVDDFNGDGATDVVSGSLAGQALSVMIANRVDGVGALQPFSLLTRFDSLEALSQFNQASNRATLQRGTIGAFQSRLEVASNNVLSTAANFSDAVGRISDIDVATETAKLLRLNILQESTTAILAQANQQGSVLLTLLEGS